MSQRKERKEGARRMAGQQAQRRVIRCCQRCGERLKGARDIAVGRHAVCVQVPQETTQRPS